MQWSDLPLRPSDRMLRQFAGLWIVVLGAAAVWQWLLAGRGYLAAVLGVLAITIGPLGLWQPRWIRPLYVGWLVAAFPIGWAVAKTMLIVIFYLVFVPIGCCLRLFGHDALVLRRPERPSYWTEMAKPDDMRRYFRQY
jgi:hypothetical protein